MKNKTVAVLALTLVAVFNSPRSTAHAQGTAFTYQGRLNASGTPASGSYDLVFTLYTTNTAGSTLAGPVTNIAVAVTNGLFTTLVDFGPGAFTGTSNWLALAVSTNGANSFSALAPRQQVTPTPYALYAANATTAASASSVPAANVTGTLGLAQLPAVVVTNSATSVNLAGSFAGNGGGLTNLTAWSLAGNPGTTNGNYLGTTDNQPLEFRVGGVRAGWISPSNGGPNITFGSAQNVISNGTAGSSILGGSSNLISTAANYSLLAGGVGNIIQNNANNSVIVGGSGNIVSLNSPYSVLGGGANNTIQSYVVYPFLGGGVGNSVANYAHRSALVGGENNSIQSYADHAFLGGGSGNSLGGSYSVLSGGLNNYINGGQNFLGGGAKNLMATSSADSVLVGGTYNTINQNMYAFLGGGSENNIQADYAIIVGGNYNVNNCGYSFLGGGNYNTIYGPYTLYSVLVGGQGNIISDYANDSFIGGGYQNTILYNTPYSFLGGGYQNIIKAWSTNSVLVGGAGNSVSNSFATVGGGCSNNATADYATVPGGANNLACGQYSFAAGSGAQATNSGAFVWSDAEGTPFTSTNANSFNVRANGGVRFVTGGAGMTLDGQTILIGSSSVLSAVVTNNEPLVTLGTLFLQNALILPNTARISAGGLTMLYSDANNNNSFGGFANQGGTNNTAIGFQALSSNPGNNNIGLGYNAGNYLSSGNNDIYIGNAGNATESGVIRIGTPGTQTATYLVGTVSVPVLTITGGSDLAEPFSISTADQPVSEGEVLVIDEANPGQLKLTDQPYDTRVAGVISGANGIHPGIQMHQQGLLEGGRNVALTGRVYVQADTSNGAIKPGDLLTTSSTPGHAMKVTDHGKAAGAILGKAMTGLAEGKGMVLVLVTLQ